MFKKKGTQKIKGMFKKKDLQKIKEMFKNKRDVQKKPP
jgi:hypothetical protein